MAATANESLTAKGLPRKSSPGHGGARAGAGRKPSTPPGQPDPYQALARAKAKRETYRAHIAELEYKEKAGELVSVEDVAEEFGAQIDIAKGRLMAVPQRVSHDLLRCDTLREIETVVRDAIIDALEELSGGKSSD